MASIYFRETGVGFPLIFIHGFCETHEIWNRFADRFAPEYRVIAIDLPGFGKSDLPAGSFTIEGVADQLSDHLEKHSIQNYILIGHSLGGYVSLALAQKYPQKCHSLVLFHSTALEDSPEKKANRDRVFDFVKINGVAPFVDTFVPGLFYNKQHASIAQVHEMALQTPQETILQYTKAMRDRPSRMDFLKSYHRPVLLVGGEQDPIIPLDSLQGITQEVPSTSLAILPNTAHMGMVEAPDHAWSIIDGFLKSRA